MQNDYRIGPSPAYAVCTVALHCGAAALLCASDAPGSVAALAVAGIAAALWQDLTRVAMRRSPDAVVSLSVRNGFWHARRRDGSTFGPAALERCRAGSPGALLVLRDARGARLRVPIPADASRPDDLRHVRSLAARALRGIPG